MKMYILKELRFITVVLALLTSAQAFSENIAYQFEGQIFGADLGGISDGTPFIGEFSYAQNRPDLNSNPDIGEYTYEYFKITIGSEVIFADLASSAPGTPPRIFINNFSPSSGDSMTIFANPAGGTVGTYASVIAFGAGFHGGEVFNDTGLPGAGLTINDFQNSNISVLATLSNGVQVSFGGLVTSLQSIPVPTTLPVGTRLRIGAGSYFEVPGFSPPISLNEGADGLVLGEVVPALPGSFHSGPLNGNPGEQGGIVESYVLLGETGTFWTDSPIVDLGGGLVDMSGWNGAWAGSPHESFDNPYGLLTVVGDSYSLDYDAIVDSGAFVGVPLILHLEGQMQPPNLPPDCSQVTPSINKIWSPSHELVPVHMLGVTDPDGDPVSLTIDSITQDEPVNSLGDGDFSPDGAGLGTSTAEVRAERSGKGNGRIYHIGFSAEDDKGGACSGSVIVEVPRDQAHSAIDDGNLYDSTSL